MSVAKSYARALFEAAEHLRMGTSGLDEIERGMTQWVSWIDGQREVSFALTSPGTSAREKAQAVQALAAKTETPPLLAQFLLVMARKQRLGILSDVLLAFRSTRLEAAGGVLGLVESADPMDAQDVAELESAFSKKVGRRVSLMRKSDPSLLAGIRVTVDGVTYDGTLSARLQRLRDRLL